MTQININNDQVLSDVNSEIKVIASLVANILTDEFGNEFLEKLNLARKSLDKYYLNNKYAVSYTHLTLPTSHNV